ncbi:hypothetical protein NB705_001936 [Xanthomonas sacchari]|nr:hypothetical protein [Xanthomonas sacchari]
MEQRGGHVQQYDDPCDPFADEVVHHVDRRFERLPAQVPGAADPGEQRGLVEAGNAEQAEVGRRAGADVAGQRHHDQQRVQAPMRQLREPVFQRRARRIVRLHVQPAPQQPRQHQEPDQQAQHPVQVEHRQRGVRRVVHEPDDVVHHRIGADEGGGGGPVEQLGEGAEALFGIAPVHVRDPGRVARRGVLRNQGVRRLSSSRSRASSASASRACRSASGSAIQNAASVIAP